MQESSTLVYSLAIEAKDANGRIKGLRYLRHARGKTTEFVPNRLYLYLLRRGWIQAETCKIPLVLGTRKRGK